MVKAMKSNRIEWIDRWRGILIFQIVAFHVFGIASNYIPSNSDYLTPIVEWMGTYHVVAFFALTGIVWTTKTSFVRFLVGKVRRLLVPYFVFGCLWALCFIALAKQFPAAYISVDSFAWWQPFASVLFCNGYPNGLGARVINALWFLPAMFSASVAYYFVDCYLPRREHQLLLLFPLYALWHMFSGNNLPWDIERIPYFILYITLGRWIIPRMPIRWVAKYWYGGLIAALVLYVCAAGHPFIKACFLKMGISGWSWIFATMMSVCASAILAQSVRWNMLGIVGRASMGILVFHKFPILAIQAMPALRRIAFSQGGGGILLCLITTILVVLASVLATEAIRRLAPWALGEKSRRD